MGTEKKPGVGSQIQGKMYMQLYKLIFAI